MAKAKRLQKRRKVWVSFFDDGEHWAFTSRKEALDINNEAATEKAVPFIETLPGDVVLSREDVKCLDVLVFSHIKDPEKRAAYLKLIRRGGR